jgi:pyrroloquinoline quinone biosynthesis protein E
MSTGVWKRVLDEAAALGVLQVHFSGGEPLARSDLADLVRHAARLELYSNIITSGVMLTDAAMAALAEAGADHIQLSFQDADAPGADDIGGYRGGHARKIAAAGRVVAAGLPLTANFVIHRLNIGRVAEMIALGEALGARRLEIAHAQYYGWGLLNRSALLPTRDQVAEATEVVEAARSRLQGVLTIDYVTPDYYAARPKACMGGWARRFINITPSGKALPCHASETLPDLAFPSVRDMPLAEIWNGSAAFQRFRGTDWMPAPCRTCDRREIDWGGCRCQALALAGDAAAADPACEKSPHRAALGLALAGAGAQLEWRPRG